LAKAPTKLKPITNDIIFVFNEQKLLILREIFMCDDDICGCDLTEKTGLSKDLLSYHIKSLRTRGFLEEVRCGVRKNYSISPAKFELVKEILKTAKMI